MDAPSPPPEPAPSAPDVVTVPCNCIICGKSLTGLPTSGNCPNCTTPVSLSLPKVQPAPVVEGLVSGDRLCVKCGKNLKGLPEEGFCPECRTPIRQSAAVQVARGKMVADDRPCLVCGYNLKGVDSAGNCPECGTPVARSLRGFLLKYSSPEYLATLKRGVILVEVTLLANVVFVIGVAAYAMYVAFSSRGAFMTPPPMPAPSGAAGAAPATVSGGVVPGFTSGARLGMTVGYEATQQIVGMIIKCAGLLGAWMFTTQDPGLTTQDPAHKSRRFLRLFLAISAVIAMATSVLVFIPGMRAQLVGAAGGIPKNLPAFTILAIVGFLGGIAQLVGFIATMNYMAHLSRRIPDAELELRAKRYRWLVPVIYVFVCAVGSIVALVMYLLLLEDWRKRLNLLGRAVLQEDVDFAANR